jgi:hypothetical protein
MVPLFANAHNRQVCGLGHKEVFPLVIRPRKERIGCMSGFLTTYIHEAKAPHNGDRTTVVRVERVVPVSAITAIEFGYHPSSHDLDSPPEYVDVTTFTFEMSIQLIGQKSQILAPNEAIAKEWYRALFGKDPEIPDVPKDLTYYVKKLHIQEVGGDDV